MNPITNEAESSSDALKAEFDSALSKVGRDIVEVKENLTPTHIMKEVIAQDRFAKIRSFYDYLSERPALVVTLGLGTGLLMAAMPQIRKTIL